ncbi:uncharacterized protein Smp_203470 [Schistosoma mansoni]|uniref:uncharacterized protein n=1 Tax=Schistosoma mansoni TaxID=6183 RepID=UPI00022DCBF2|nr:uncharacterized protein Smp_203470 [Schistosoma mansoni]|eukprot:XP_018654279.1 uncharacterized protein Smp_203470 [Schistosoma mansoni]
MHTGNSQVFTHASHSIHKGTFTHPVWYIVTAPFECICYSWLSLTRYMHITGTKAFTFALYSTHEHKHAFPLCLRLEGLGQKFLN